MDIVVHSEFRTLGSKETLSVIHLNFLHLWSTSEYSKCELDL